jgi:hypothetical protein
MVASRRKSGVIYVKSRRNFSLGVVSVQRTLRSTTLETSSVLEEFPPGLEPLYNRMVGQVRQKDEESLRICEKKFHF